MIEKKYYNETAYKKLGSILLYRYVFDSQTGKKKTIATIYTRKEHSINQNQISKEVLLILKKLKAHHYESYIVGGAVRDLLLNRIPKDFDIATAATPQQIHKIFSNSRIIGKRFKLCHIFYGTLIVEVSTFRSAESDNFLNRYGSIEEDVWRRDFSINAFYYDPFTEKLFDYVGAMKDFQKRQIRSLINLDETFHQDPVRMVRAVKYSVQTGFKMVAPLKKAIRRDASLLGTVSISRIVEEFFKIVFSGHAYSIFRLLRDFKIFPFFLSSLSEKMDRVSSVEKQFFSACRLLDSTATKEVEFLRAWAIATLFQDQVVVNVSLKETKEIFFDLFNQLKELIFPLTPANRDLHRACRLILKEKGIETNSRQFHFEKWIQEKKKRQKEESEAK